MLHIMTTLNGLRHLQKNVASFAATRLANRTRRIPKRVVYYSRFASQLNFLRWSDHLSIKQIVNDDIERSSEAFDLEELNLNVPSPPGDDSKTKQKLTSYSKTDNSSPLFLDQVEFHENDYIYKHVHKRLDRFADIGDLLHTLSVAPYIKQLIDFIKEKQDLDKSTSEKHFEAIMFNIRDCIKTMNQQELAILLTAIKNYDEEEFRRVKRMIDIELRWLLKKHVKTRLMDLDLWFYVADIFYECLMPSTFVNVLVNYISKENEINLSNAQFLHMLFLVILQRNQKGILSHYENRIHQILGNASFEDIATISMAYFKTKTQIQNADILKKMIDRTVELIPKIDADQPGYCSVIKSIRYSNNHSCRESVLHLVMTLLDDSNRRIIFSSPYNAVHTIKMMETYRIYEPKILDHLSGTMFQNLDEFRIKDIQYALTSLSNFAYKDLVLDAQLEESLDKLSQQVVSEIRDDVYKQSFHIMPLLRAFAIFGFYNDNLIRYVNNLLADPVQFKNMAKAIEFDKSALLLYVASRLEGKEANLGSVSMFKDLSTQITRYGNLGSVRQDSSIKHLDFVLRGTSITNMYYVNSQLYRNVAKSLAFHEGFRDLSYKFNFQYTLPHQNYADLVITRDCREPGQYSPETLMPLEIPSGQKCCLIQGARKQDYIDGYNRLSGYKRLVSRLLTKIGYTVITVDFDEPDIALTVFKIKSALED